MHPGEGPQADVRVAAEPRYAVTAPLLRNASWTNSRTGDPRLVDDGRFSNPPMSGPTTDTARPAKKNRPALPSLHLFRHA